MVLNQESNLVLHGSEAVRGSSLCLGRFYFEKFFCLQPSYQNSKFGAQGQLLYSTVGVFPVAQAVVLTPARTTCHFSETQFSLYTNSKTSPQPLCGLRIQSEFMTDQHPNPQACCLAPHPSFHPLNKAQYWIGAANTMSQAGVAPVLKLPLLLDPTASNTKEGNDLGKCSG